MPAGRLRLMLVTDRRAARIGLEATVRAALEGGVTAVQLREGDLPAGDLLPLAVRLGEECRRAGALFVVNDRLDVALAAGADGAHLKRVSLPVRDARRILGPGRVLGVSTHAPAEVEAAFDEGADYCVFGPVFPTPSKAGILAARGAELCRRVAEEARGPVVALGGVDVAGARRLAGSSVAGIAVVRAILAAEDPAAAARALRAAFEGAVEETR